MDVVENLIGRVADHPSCGPDSAREWFEVGVVIVEPADCFADGQAAGGDDGVDGGAAVATGPAPPPLHTVGVGGDGDRWVLVGVAGFGAMPEPSMCLPVAGGDCVEDVVEVGACEYFVAVDVAPLGVRGSGHATIASSVLQMACSWAAITCCTTAARPATVHTARPRVRRGSRSTVRWFMRNRSPVVVELVGGLPEHDAGLDVREETFGDFGRRGAGVGLGVEVREPVGDEDVPDPPQAAQLQPSLEGFGGAFGGHRGPHFVVDEDAASTVFGQ